MEGRRITVKEGRYQDWAVQIGDQATWTSGTIARWVTASSPRPAGLENLHVDLRLLIGPGDPQWDLFIASRHPGGRAVNTVALDTALARIATALADRNPATDWHPHASHTYRPELVAAAHSIAGPGTTVTLTASAHRPEGHAARTAHRAFDVLVGAARTTAQRDDAVGWLLDTVPTLPGMPAAGTDWASATAAFLSQPFPGAPRPGQIKVVFSNAINYDSERRWCADVDEARRLAGEYQPYNNTRIDAHRVVSVHLGIPTFERVDLTAGPAAGRSALGGPAALARAFEAPAEAGHTSAGAASSPRRPTDPTTSAARPPAGPRR